jgi:hydroxymethylpyrimidine pyrophosphatase-like HAD family hydrolase
MAEPITDGLLPGALARTADTCPGEVPAAQPPASHLAAVGIDCDGGALPPAAHGTVAYFRVVAVDFDGTLAADGTVSSEALAAVAASRASGVRVVLVTGRILAELVAVFPGFERLVDAVVAENGAVLVLGGRRRLLAAPVEERLADALSARGIGYRQGQVLLVCTAAEEERVLQEVRRLGLDCQLVRNRGELMVLPAGVTKATGLLQALGELGLSRHNTVAVGDAENDLSLLAACELGVAVADAVPSVREHADVVLEQPDGAGVAQLLRDGVLAGRELFRPHRWRVMLGADRDGRAVHLPASQLNLLVVGGSGDGKSYVAGLLAEQLIALGYSLFVIDPEGDHIGLGQLQGVLVVAADGWLPSPGQLVRLVHHRYATVVLDLSGLDAGEQAAYLAGIPAEVAARRATTGLPQWVLIDEAHESIGRHGAARAVFDPATKGHCLVTWRPQDLQADAIAGIDAVVALATPQPAGPVVDLTAAVADLPRATVAGLLNHAPAGDAVLADRSRPRQAVVFTPAARVTAHHRHAHKYRVFRVAAAERFHFRSEGNAATGASAGNLHELRIELGRCDRGVLRHHCPNGDLSRWVREVLHDPHLAQAVAAIERAVEPSAPAALVEAARLALLALLQQHDPTG